MERTVRSIDTCNTATNNSNQHNVSAIQQSHPAATTDTASHLVTSTGQINLANPSSQNPDLQLKNQISTPIAMDHNSGDHGHQEQLTPTLISPNNVQSSVNESNEPITTSNMESTQKTETMEQKSQRDPISLQTETPEFKATTNAPDTTNNNSNESSNHSSSTAFTITFDDDENTSLNTSAFKRLGIRDSIRKFAPPKPNTIERPRAPKSNSNNNSTTTSAERQYTNSIHQENSLTSVESAPANLINSERSGYSFNRSTLSNDQSQSKSPSKYADRFQTCNSTDLNTRQISDSAAFLIDKMLSEEKRNLTKHQTNRKREDDIEAEVDFWEDKSDNGTYIVGADPESDAARKKIDELFGLKNAAGASLLANSRDKGVYQASKLPPASPSRLARPTEKKSQANATGVLSRERQEHINRLAKLPARSSSGTRQDNDVRNQQRQPRTSSRRSQNSSCDRTSGKSSQVNNQTNISNVSSTHRRSASQSSRHSSGRELSDNDTRSSRSSLHNDTNSELTTQSLRGLPGNNSSTSSMKFNRAFALRRARLGLGEPGESLNATANNLSQRRYQTGNSATNQRGTINQSGGSSSYFCREDGGRYSLRMRAGNITSRLYSSLGVASNASSSSNTRTPQTTSNVDNYLTKTSTPIQNSEHHLVSPRRFQQQYQYQQQAGQISSVSNEETGGLTSPFRYASGRHISSSSRLQQEPDTTRHQDMSLPMNPADLEVSCNLANSSEGGGRQMASSGLQLGALDSLVISAISSLSLKIRQSVCDILVEQAKKLPADNETRSIVEEILPQLKLDPLSSKSPTSIEEIDQTLYFDLAKTLKNLKKVEQMVDVIGLISNQLPLVRSPSNPSDCSSQ